jgi:hypothetical protein
MFKLLLDEPPLVVLPSLAKRIGLNEAIVLQQVHYWLVSLRETKRTESFKEGRWWIYHSYAQWAETFPFWSEVTIKRTFLDLEKRGLLLSAQLADDPRDRRKWYTIDYDAYARIVEPCPWDQNDTVDGIKMIRSIGSNGYGAPALIDTPHRIGLIRSLKEEETTEETKAKDTAAEVTVAGATGRGGSAAVLAPPGSPEKAEASPPSLGTPPEKPSPDPELVAQLVAADLNRADALRLATASPDECRCQLGFLPYIAEFTSSKGAYLRTAIEQGFAPPPAYEREQRAKRAAEHRRRRTQKAGEEKQSAAAAKASQRAILEAEKARLAREAPGEWERIVAEAAAALPAVLRSRPQHVAYGPALSVNVDRLVAARLA